MVKIKFALVDSDAGYVNKMAGYLNGKYASEIEVFIFTQIELFESFIKEKAVDVILISEKFDFNIGIIPKKSAFAYLVESNNIASYKGKKAVGKFQKLELFYKEILNLYSDIAGEASWTLKDAADNETRLITFLSAAGGAGGSTMAAACALNLAARQQSVLYLCLDCFGSSNTYFNADGPYNLGDVFFALKSRKPNITYKIKSAVKKDVSGVYFFDPCRMPFDMRDMSREGYKFLFDELKKSGMFNYIIIDTEVTLQDSMNDILAYSSCLIMVTDGKAATDARMNKIIDSLKIIEEQKNFSILDKMALLQNKYDKGQYIASTGAFGAGVLENVGFYSENKALELAKQIAQTNVFYRF